MPYTPPDLDRGGRDPLDDIKLPPRWPKITFYVAVAVSLIAARYYYFDYLPAKKLRVAAEARAVAEARALASARSDIVIHTTPEGAEVRVGDFAPGRSPLTLKAQKLGRYPVHIRLENSDGWDGEIEVTRDKVAELKVPLVRYTGRLLLTTEPAGLAYCIEGTECRKEGLADGKPVELPTGLYSITISRPDYAPEWRMVEVRRNEQTVETVAMLNGGIEITSRPSGAEVRQDGRVVGRTPYRADVLPADDYCFALKLDGYKYAKRTVHVASRQTARETVSLERQTCPEPGQPWTNGLGMMFVPVPGVNVLFSIWETRVKDYDAFARATKFDPNAGEDTYNGPRFEQGPTHPVVRIWQDGANAFCRWLTDSERSAGRLSPNQEYRLPTIAEWNAAVGPTKYPWGDQFPPPPHAGNYLDVSARDKYGKPVTNGYNDGYEYTAPVGRFAPNKYGIYDLGGNVWEWMGDKKVQRGGSFREWGAENLLSNSGRHEFFEFPGSYGFRVVCAVGSVR